MVDAPFSRRGRVCPRLPGRVIEVRGFDSTRFRGSNHLNTKGRQLPRPRNVGDSHDRRHPLKVVDCYTRFLARRSLSPFADGLPTPARLRMLSAFGMLARAARSAKYLSVRKADSFSATATLMSWLSATPSASAIWRASS